MFEEMKWQKELRGQPLFVFRFSPCPTRPASIKLIVRLIFLAGPQPTLNFLGSSAVLLKGVHIIVGHIPA